MINLNRFRNNNKKTKDIIVNYILVISMIIPSGIALLALEQFITVRQIATIVNILLFAVAVGIKIIQKRKINGNVIVLIILSFVYLILCFMIGTDNISGLFLKIALFDIVVLYIKFIPNRDELYKIFYYIVLILAVVSLAFFVLINLFNVALPYAVYSETEYTQYNSYWYVFYTYSEYKKNILGLSFYRLQGPFWEPGVYSIYLVLAIFYHVFKKSKIIVSQLLLLFISLILTTSTTGLIVGIIILGISWLEATKLQFNKLMVLLFSTVMGGLGSIVIFLKKVNDGGLSFSLRLYDFVKSIEVWKNNFIFGCGYNNTAAFMDEGRTGNSNGLLNWCMTMGIVGLIVVVGPFVVNCFFAEKKYRIMQLTYSFVFIVLNMTEPVVTTPIIISLIATEYVKLIKNLRHRRTDCGYKGKENSFNCT